LQGAEGALGGAAERFEQTLDPGQAVLRIRLQTIFDCGGQVASPRSPKIAAVPARVGDFLGNYCLKKPFDADQLVAAVQCLAISH
jgi:hypothetical protein